MKIKAISGLLIFCLLRVPVDEGVMKRAVALLPSQKADVMSYYFTRGYRYSVVVKEIDKKPNPLIS